MIALDLFAGGGCAARGLFAAGFDKVVGADIADHSRAYPGDFLVCDALTLTAAHLLAYDFVWASPPCQRFSVQNRGRPDKANANPNLIPATRALLASHPITCIENVPAAPIRPDIILSGSHVGLPKLRRIRHFELSFPCVQPPRAGAHPTLRTGLVTPSMKGGAGTRQRIIMRELGRVAYFTRREMAEAMGIDPAEPLTRAEIGEGVPPKYAEVIGRAAIDFIGGLSS